MGKHNVASGGLVLAVILMIAISSLMVVSYTTGILTAAVNFASTDQIAKLTACGITAPTELFQLKADIPGLLLPVIYVGFPGLMIVLSILMFIAGYYYGAGREGHSSSETTTTTDSSQNRRNSGRFAPGQHVEKTQTRSSESEGN